MYLNSIEIIIPVTLFFIGLLNHYFLIREKRIDQKSFVLKLYLHALITLSVGLLTPFDQVFSLLTLSITYLSIIVFSYIDRNVFNMFFSKTK